MRSVIALYEDRNLCRSAMDDLVEHGFEKETIRVVTDGHDTTGRTENDLMQDLNARNVPREDAELYIDGVRKGRALMFVDTSDDRAVEASSILDRHAPLTFEGTREGAERAERFEELEVVEEEVKIGKRPVQRGGVRIHTYVTERPVEQDVELREEHVRVERHPTDEPLSPTEAERAFREETIEVRTHGEEPMVTKEARVVERVDVEKEAKIRREHIAETERRQDVEVEALSDSDDDEESRRDWEANYKAKGIDYETYRHAYGLGHRMGGEDRRADWNTAESGLRREWEERHHRHGPWDKFRAAIQRGWDRARGK